MVKEDTIQDRSSMAVLDMNPFSPEDTFFVIGGRIGELSGRF
jgi:hypothetical protein